MTQKIALVCVTPDDGRKWIAERPWASDLVVDVVPLCNFGADPVTPQPALGVTIEGTSAAQSDERFAAMCDALRPGLASRFDLPMTVDFPRWAEVSAA